MIIMFEKSIYDNPTIKKLKIILIITIGLIVVLDIVFVAVDQFPTVSQVIQDSSPKYLVLIWLYGVATANIFFPLTKHEKQLVPKKLGAVSLAVICLALFVYGFTFKQPVMNCQNYQDVEIEKIYQLIIKTKVRDAASHDKIDPASMIIQECSEDKFEFKIDLRTDVKLLLVIFGIISGYLFWRQRIPSFDKVLSDYIP